MSTERHLGARSLRQTSTGRGGADRPFWAGVPAWLWCRSVRWSRSHQYGFPFGLAEFPWLVQSGIARSGPFLSGLEQEERVDLGVVYAVALNALDCKATVIQVLHRIGERITRSSA